LADIPGGNTGLLVRDYKGRNADKPVYKADTALMAEMRATERQAAEEMGQWVERREKRRNGPNYSTRAASARGKRPLKKRPARRRKRRIEPAAQWRREPDRHRLGGGVDAVVACAELVVGAEGEIWR